MDKYKWHMAAFTLGAIFGWGVVTKVWMPEHMVEMVDNAHRLSSTSDDILDLVVGHIEKGTFDDLPEFQDELSEILTWINVVLTEEL